MHALSSPASAVQAGARPGTRDREDRSALEYAEAARCASAVSALARAEDEANGVARGTAPIWQDTPRAGPLGVAGGFEILGPARRPPDLSVLGADEESLDGGYDAQPDANPNPNPIPHPNPNPNPNPNPHPNPTPHPNQVRLTLGVFDMDLGTDENGVEAKEVGPCLC